MLFRLAPTGPPHRASHVPPLAWWICWASVRSRFVRVGASPDLLMLPIPEGADAAS